MKDRLIIPVLEDSLAANSVAKRRFPIKSVAKKDSRNKLP